MDTQPAFGLEDLLAHVVGGIAKAVSERDGESQHQQFVRCQAAVQTILTFLPRDAITAMLAGHCVMFHELIADSVHFTMRGEAAATRRATRSSIVAMDKAFGNNLARLEHDRTRHAEGQPEARPANARAETEIADRVHRHQSQTPARTQAGSGQAGPSAPEAGSIPRDPSPETIAACPAAIAALDPAGTGRFAQTAGADQPSEACQAAAAAQMAGLNRQARREIGRQARKRIVPAMARMASPDVTPTRCAPATTISATA
jgi:hypothetical protein